MINKYNKPQLLDKQPVSAFIYMKQAKETS